MNIAFLTSEYPHISVGKSGGIGTSIRNFAQAYCRLGHNVFVFVIHKHFTSFHDDGIRIICVENKIRLRGLLGVYLKSKEIQKEINVQIHQNNIQFIEVPDWAGIAAFIAFQCPTVVKIHGTDAYFCKLEKRKQKPKNYLLEWLNIRKADKLISVSKYAASVTSKIFGIPESSFNIIPNGISLDNFPPEENNLTPQNKRKNILYLGSVVRKKGCLEIPGIFNELLLLAPQTELILVGSDTGDIATGNKSTWSMMAPLFNEQNKVHFEGVKPYNEIRKIISEADVCIFPSFAEALPMTWLEAMAMKKPVVASNIGWATEIILDGTDGFLVDPKDHQTFASKINYLLTNPEKSLAMSDAARKKIENYFDIDKVAAAQLTLFN